MISARAKEAQLPLILSPGPKCISRLGEDGGQDLKDDLTKTLVLARYIEAENMEEVRLDEYKQDVPASSLGQHISLFACGNSHIGQTIPFS